MFKLFLEILPVSLACVTLIICISRNVVATTMLAKSLTSAAAISCIILLAAQVVSWLPGNAEVTIYGQTLESCLWVLFDVFVVACMGVAAYKLKE